jgi:acetylornithine/succinyldiaminopimelate/putrescine aminotransferase
MSSPLSLLAPLRALPGQRRTVGLSDALITEFAVRDPQLIAAINDALSALAQLKRDGFVELLNLDERDQALKLQADFVNFYNEDAVNPYVALGGRGPWIVTSKGAVVHDNGGYGMLGSGHAPDAVLAAMARPQVMANIMSPSFSQLRLTEALKREIGQNRADGCPFAKFLCLNSGSESVTLAGRLADVNTKLHTDAGGRHAGKRVKRIAVRGAFHGRTELPAMYSDSSRKAYQTHLASYKHHDHQLMLVEPYSLDGLRGAFAEAQAQGWYIEAMFLEPVMGEGNPGRAVTPEFYALARELTLAHGTLLLVDSIQAGLRAHGVLSVVDYPGFENLPAPDLETYSKALNAGQYPLSVLAVTPRAAALYRKGIYGNTMTTNPRAMDVAVAVLDALTPALRQNIRDRGVELVAKLEALKDSLGGAITAVQGTGLLVSCELSGEFKCYGAGSTEEYLRERGIGVIHGGTNALRFTPHFAITSTEVDLIVDGVRDALLNGPQLPSATPSTERALA